MINATNSTNPTCSNCGNSPEGSEQPFLKCKERNAYFPRKWHCGKWSARATKHQKPNKTEVK